MSSSSFVVAIPTVNNHDLLREALDAIARSSVRPKRVILIDNGDATPLCADPSWLAKNDAYVIRPESNLGCAGSWNLGIRLSAPLPVVLLNDDCEVAVDTFDRMLVAPLGRIVCAHGFSCFRIDPAVVRAAGYFDEGFYPVYYEDTDYRRRCRLAGVPIDEWDRSNPVLRNGRDFVPATGITHGKDQNDYQRWSGDKLAWFRTQLERNRCRYLAKWGGEVNGETYTTPFDGRPEPEDVRSTSPVP